MSWLTIDPTLSALLNASGSSPWHIKEIETVFVDTRREMALHGEFRVEGTLILKGTARLRVQL